MSLPADETHTRPDVAETSGTTAGGPAAAQGWDIRPAQEEAECQDALVRFRREHDAYVVWWIRPKIEGVDESWARQLAQVAEHVLREAVPLASPAADTEPE